MKRINGGQSGNADCQINQTLESSTANKTPIEFVDEIGALPNPNFAGSATEIAAVWLHQNRGNIRGSVIAAIKHEFGLTNLAAIDAAKRAHTLAYGGGHE